MQVKLFTIPVVGGEKLTEELNVFLRSRKILQTENHIVQSNQGAFWCFCIKYIEDSKGTKTFSRKEKINYKEVLDEVTFLRFSEMRQIRKMIAQAEAIPAYAVFTDAELAEIAKIGEKRNLTDIRKIKGIGAKKLEKYGAKFVQI